MCLTFDEIREYAIQNYTNNACCGAEEFEYDLRGRQRVKGNIKKLIEGRNCNFRLLINHIIVFYNVFEWTAATDLLFLAMPKDYMQTLKTILVALDKYPFDLDKNEERKFMASINIDKRLLIKIQKEIRGPNV